MLKSVHLSRRFIGWNTFSSFNFNMILICGLAIANILYKVQLSSDGIYLASNLWNPTTLLFGPLLYWSIRANLGLEIKNIGWHLIPFFIAVTFYSMALNNTTSSANLQGMYQTTSWATPLSLFTYIIIILTGRKAFKPAEDARFELLTLIYMSFLFITIIATMIYLCDIMEIDMGINYLFFTHALLLFVTIFILRYFYISTKTAPQSTLKAPSYINSPINDERADVYIQKIHQYFEASQVFLRPDLSLNVLANELDIPKHYFSQLFNVHMGKSFYQYVAEHRVAYATKRMKKEDITIKIESLAYECGFNSKTSFNKYFKSIVGCTPIEYLKQIDSAAINQVF